MPFVLKPPPLPPPSQPMVEPTTGLITEAWYLYFKAFTAWLVKMGAAIP